MRAIYLALISLLYFSYSKAQSESSSKIFNISAEQQPVFPGGDAALYKFIQQNIRYPDVDTGGKVIIRVLIDTDGSVTDVTVAKSVSPDLDKAAIKVVKLLPKFQPGYTDGKPVKVYHLIPIVFAWDERRRESN